MLKPAQLYQPELERKIFGSWYKPENIFWNYNSGDAGVELPCDNHTEHHFVSVNEYFDVVVGYIGYEVDWEAMSVSGLGVISFDKGNPIFTWDLYRAICNIFCVYHMNRIQWTCFADNPALEGYRKFIKRHGGRECGYYKESRKLQDGKLHDCVLFEIMASEFNGKQYGNGKHGS